MFWKEILIKFYNKFMAAIMLTGPIISLNISLICRADVASTALTENGPSKILICMQVPSNRANLPNSAVRPVRSFPYGSVLS